jgi:hypothetical protein
MRTFGYALLAVGVVLAVTATDAIAGITVVPEINPGSVSAGLALLAGGVLLARARWRK